MVTLSVLVMTGGALATVVVEEMICEAHEGETSRLDAISSTAGFTVFPRSPSTSAADGAPARAQERDRAASAAVSGTVAPSGQPPVAPAEPDRRRREEKALVSCLTRASPGGVSDGT
ncbi:hypothetical protein [Modestobacter sp. DSM 44400]|uniref:hypothetical protein n=1 Tax=Modestobacter sp. DSM 44400 TaxID=1550230 RepID=UPI001C318299|nr:hypothetical protein [Modestobacter sp. DSM 44400]